MSILKRRKNMSPPPPHGLDCPLSECMKLIGGVWTPNIIWYLSGGARRFSELKDDIPPISSKVLSARLKEMEEKGVVTRTVLPTTPPTVEYSLTELGQGLVPAIAAIVKVGKQLKEQA